MRSRILGWGDGMKREPKQEYFQKALSDFTFDVASGGAIRHLADRGYTVSQIMKMLDFPTPFDRVQQIVWKHFLDKGIVLLREPDREAGEEKYGYVTEYDAYGRRSFRRVVVKEPSKELIRWSESRFCQDSPEGLFDFLKRKSQENGEEFSYVSCDFGLYSKRDPEGYERLLEVLEPSLREYVRDIPWERKMAYHRLDERMQKIAACLFTAGYGCKCYFMKTQDKVWAEASFAKQL